MLPGLHVCCLKYHLASIDTLKLQRGTVEQSYADQSHFCRDLKGQLGSLRLQIHKEDSICLQGGCWMQQRSS